MRPSYRPSGANFQAPGANFRGANRGFAVNSRTGAMYGANNWNRTGVNSYRTSLTGVRFDGSRTTTFNRSFSGASRATSRLNRTSTGMNRNSTRLGSNSNRANRLDHQGVGRNGSLGSERVGRNGTGNSNFAGRNFARNGNGNGDGRNRHHHHNGCDDNFIFFGGFGFPFYSAWDYGYYPWAYYPYYQADPYSYDPYAPIDNGAPIYGDGSVPQDPGYNQSDDGRHYERGGGGADDHSLVAQVQERLANDGYYKGSIDGVKGSRTFYAIRAYQREHHLPVTGEINDELLGDMGLQ
jgi:putative peptidoglycan binding protein